MNSATWCVVYTQPLKESVAQRNLIDQGYEVYVPRFKKTCRHARKVEEKCVPLFSRYIFARINVHSARWRSVNSTCGVSYLLMSNETTPSSIHDDVIETLRAQEIGEGLVPLSSLVTFVKGEKIRIADGAFKDHVALFESFDDKSRVRLLLNFMGRDVNLVLPCSAVEGV
jgi:transcriptional antiterminator RfaH